MAYQGDRLGEAGDQVQRQHSKADGSPEECHAQHCGVLYRCVEGGTLVVDRKGDQLNDELHQEAHAVHQVWLEVRTGLLYLILQPCKLPFGLL